MSLPAPNMIGLNGKAWRFDLDAIRASAPIEIRKDDASVASWLIEAPWANIAWHSYALHLIHLRPIPGAKPCVIKLPGAEHQICLFALAPDKPIGLSVGKLPEHLFPMNFSAQFIAENDEAAIARVNDTVREIIDGTLSPDTDHIQSWIARYGDNMVIGDPKRAGETKIVLGGDGRKDVEIVIDPQRPRPRQS